MIVFKKQSYKAKNFALPTLVWTRKQRAPVFAALGLQGNMHRSISLSEYVKKRNGVALGAKGSMSNMLKRSLGASSFNLFWQYWNPIWGYYLSRKIMKPLSQLLPAWLAIIMTFAASGALHDLAITLVKWELTFFFTPWFSLMSLIVLATKKFGISYREHHWLIRASINIIFIAVCLVLTRQVT